MATDSWIDLQRLAASVLDEGDESDTAWSAFWTELQPRLEQWVRNPGFLGRISQRDDYCRDIVLLTWEKLQHNNYNKLRAYFKRHQDSRAGSNGNGFDNWLFRVFKNIGIDYMRKLPEYMRRPHNGHHPVGSRDDKSDAYWRSVVTLHTQEKAVYTTITGSATARQLLEFLDHSVPERQRTAAQLFRAGASI
ncbi:MAG: hypothetical protein AAGC55_31200, partial [Myxococcota bacterium]